MENNSYHFDIDEICPRSPAFKPLRLNKKCSFECPSQILSADSSEEKKTRQDDVLNKYKIKKKQKKSSIMIFLTKKQQLLARMSKNDIYFIQN